MQSPDPNTNSGVDWHIVQNDLTSISSVIPCASAVSRASGPPGFAATAMTGQPLNLRNHEIKTAMMRIHLPAYRFIIVFSEI